MACRPAGSSSNDVADRAASSGSARPPARAGPRAAAWAGIGRRRPRARALRCSACFMLQQGLAAAPPDGVRAPCPWRRRIRLSGSPLRTPAASADRSRCGAAPPAGPRATAAADRPARCRARLFQRVLHRQRDPLHHGVEQVGLVLEVPVDGAAAGAGRRRDVAAARCPTRPAAGTAARPHPAGCCGSRARLPWCGGPCPASIHSPLHVYCDALPESRRPARLRRCPLSSRNSMPDLPLPQRSTLFVPGCHGCGRAGAAARGLRRQGAGQRAAAGRRHAAGRKSAWSR